MPQRVRMDSLGGQARCGTRCRGHVLLQKVPDAESRYWGAALIDEDLLFGWIARAAQAPADQVSQQLRRLRPNWAGANLVSLAEKANLARRLEPNVPGSKIDDLLYPGAGIEHQGEHRVVSPSALRGPVDSVQQRLDLVLLKVLDRIDPLTDRKSTRLNSSH